MCDGAVQGNFSLNYSSASHTEKLTALLKDLRIEADLFPVSGWAQVVQDGGNMEYLLRFSWRCFCCFLLGDRCRLLQGESVDIATVKRNGCDFYLFAGSAYWGA